MITTHHPDRVEYEPGDDGYWSIEDFAALATDFDLRTDEVEAWHTRFSGQGRAWEILRLLYQCAPLLTPDEDSLRPWTRAEIGKKLGISLAIVEGEIGNAVKEWQLRRAQAKAARAADEVTAEEGGYTRFSLSDQGDVARVDQLLAEYNFDEVRGPALRAQVASRILSLREWIESPNTRMAARELIRMEISMHGKEKLLSSLNNELERRLTEDPDREDDVGMIDSLATKVEAVDKQLRTLATAYVKLQKDIGADEGDKASRKRTYIDTVAYLQEQCRLFESDPENLHVDGVFTAAEIDWLLEEGPGGRDPQYRPDISIRLYEALMPENLWDPHYRPTPIQQRVCQELRRIVKTLRALPEDAPPLNEAFDEEDEEGSLTGADVLSTMPIDDGDAPLPTSAPRHTPTRKPAMRVFS